MLAFASVLLSVAAVLFAFNRAGGWPLDRPWKLLWPTAEGVLAAALIWTWLRAGPLLPRPLATAATAIGTISYSVYMVHFAVLQAMVRQGWFIRPTGFGHYDALLSTVLIGMPVSLALGALLFVTVERPFLSLRPRYVATTPPAPVPP